MNRLFRIDRVCEHHVYGLPVICTCGGWWPSAQWWISIENIYWNMKNFGSPTYFKTYASNGRKHQDLFLNELIPIRY